VTVYRGNAGELTLHGLMTEKVIAAADCELEEDY
jgi:hypothetical protein